jgi:hypothetical protein
MDQRLIEIGEVRMSFAGAGHASERAERISRLMFEHIHTMMDGSLRDLEQAAEIDYLEVGPIHVSFDTMDDDTIAEVGATEIYRALSRAS